MTCTLPATARENILALLLNVNVNSKMLTFFSFSLTSRNVHGLKQKTVVIRLEFQRIFNSNEHKAYPPAPPIKKSQQFTLSKKLVLTFS